MIHKKVYNFKTVNIQYQGWKILKFFTRPTSPYVLVNSILNIGHCQNFYSSYSIRHSPWRADEWIFPALNICGENSYGIYENMFLSISHMSYVGIKSPDNDYFSCYFGQIALCTIRHLENGGN